MPKQTNPKNKISKKVENEEVDDIEVDEDVDVEEVEEVEEDVEDIEDANEADGDDIEIKSKSKSKKKIEYKSESAQESLDYYNELTKEINEIDNNRNHKQKLREVVFKTFVKQSQKESKRSKKRKENNPDAPKRKTGFIKAKFVPDKFKSFYESNLRNNEHFSTLFPDFNIEEDQSQTTITKIIYKYIQMNELYEKNEDGSLRKNAILPDKTLSNLLLIEDGETIGFKNFQRYMKRLYNSNVVEESTASGAESN
jgi:hypothetical protein